MALTHRLPFSGDGRKPIIVSNPNIPKGYINKGKGERVEFGYGGKLNLVDKRVLHPLRGDNLLDTERKNYSNIDSLTVDNLVKKSYQNNQDPNEILAMGLQETGLGQGEYKNNPLHNNGMIDDFEKLKQKNDLAKRLGKTSDEERIQSWNGYGKVFPIRGSFYGLPINKLESMNKMGPDPNDPDGKKLVSYGVQKGIDMSKNPIYGKQIVNLRDSVIKQSPEIQAIVKKHRPKLPYTNIGSFPMTTFE